MLLLGNVSMPVTDVADAPAAEYSTLLYRKSMRAFIPSRCAVLFAGDAMQHTAQLEAAKEADGGYDFNYCFSQIGPTVSKADLAIGNLEVTLGNLPFAGYPSFSAPEEYAEALKECGFDIMMTCNNHCMDRGPAGMIRTLDILDSLGIRHFGTYRNKAERDEQTPLVATANGIDIALLGYTYGTNTGASPYPCTVNVIDTTQMAADIHKARQSHPDCIIVCIHWGTEYRTRPDVSQRRLAQWLIDAGADHVIGTHPHVSQPTEELHRAGMDRHVVAYSLGNFISNMSAPHTDRAELLRIGLLHFGGNTWLDTWEAIPVRTLRPSASGLPNFKVITY